MEVGGGGAGGTLAKVVLTATRTFRTTLEAEIRSRLHAHPATDGHIATSVLNESKSKKREQSHTSAMGSPCKAWRSPFSVARRCQPWKTHAGSANHELLILRQGNAGKGHHLDSHGHQTRGLVPKVLEYVKRERAERRETM